MKRFVFVALVAGLVLVGCGTKEEREAKRLERLEAQEIERVIYDWNNGGSKKDADFVLGVAKGLHELDTSKHPEVVDVRKQVNQTLGYKVLDETQYLTDQEDVNEAKQLLADATTYGDPNDPNLKVAKKHIEEKEKEIAKTNEILSRPPIKAAETPPPSRSDALATYSKAIGDIEIAVTGVEGRQELEGKAVNGNGTIVMVSLHLKNTGTETVHVNPLNLTLVAETEVENIDDLTYRMNDYFDAIDLPPGKEHSGWVCFVAPKISGYYALTYKDSSGNMAYKEFKL